MDLQILLTFAIITVTTRVLSSTIKKCNRKDPNFQQCLPKAIEDILHKSSSPIKELHLIQLEPLEVPSMLIEAGTKAVTVKQVYKNLKISGFSKATCSKANMDFGTNTFTLDCTSPLARMDFTYEISGKILLLPVSGTGPGWIELVDTNVKTVFNLEKFEKKGQEHYKVVSTELNLTPQLGRVNLDNLFNGDKAMGDNLNKVINENWSQLFGEIKTTYEGAFKNIFGSIFNQVLAKMSIVEMFGEA